MSWQSDALIEQEGLDDMTEGQLADYLAGLDEPDFDDSDE